MAIRAVAQNTFTRYIPGSGFWNGKYKVDVSMLNKFKDDTFIAIFSPGTENNLKQFEKQSDKYKVLFRNEKKAINTIHGTAPRNTVIVFELKLLEDS